MENKIEIYETMNTKKFTILHSNDMHGDFLAEVQGEKGELIGGCGFDGLRIGKTHGAEIAYWLAKPYWGRGIMTAAVRRVCEHGVAEFGLVKIIAHVFDFNIASARVLEKCGRRAARLRLARCQRHCHSVWAD